MLPEHFIHQVQQATDIIELVGQSVTIRQRGKDYVGLCPFHQEKTPSFYVSPAKQIFKCFGCGAGGGVFQFVMLQQKCAFPEAVKLLAERANIPIPADDGAEPGDAALDRSQLVRVMQFAKEFYQAQLRSPAGRAALDYAHGRQLTDAGIDRFELGYAPDNWDSLCQAALQAGYSDKQLLAVGLIARSERSGRYYDRFRHRLMFPIADAAGRVIAFGGRALSAEERAKYLNSPETALFDKSSHLYGLSWARQAIGRTGTAVVVEGYLDAVMPAQAGVENVVATLGTALTERHVRMLSRLAGDVVLVFDADTAGAAAAERGLELFIAQQVNVRVATVGEGKDPCDFVLAAGAESFRQLIAQAPDALEYVWQKRSEQYLSSGDLVGKRQAAEEFLRLVVSSTAYGAIEPIRQGLLVNRLAGLLGLPADQLSRQMARLARQFPRASAVQTEDPSAPTEATSVGLLRAQRMILEVLIAQPDHFEHVARHLGPEDFTDPLLGAVAREVWRLGAADALSLEGLLAVQAGPQWGGLVTDLSVSAEERGNYDATLAGAMELIEHGRRREHLAELRQAGDDEALRKLTEHLRKPDPRRRPAVS